MNDGFSLENLLITYLYFAYFKYVISFQETIKSSCFNYNSVVMVVSGFS